MSHIPVLLKETIEILNPKSGEFFIDGTIGSGGHAAAILEKIGPKGLPAGRQGKLLGIDWNNNAVEKLKNEKFRNLKNVILVQGNYADLPEILEKYDLPKADGIILDLGFSSESLQLGRGFSFLKDEPLDMRYDESKGITVAEIINGYGEKDLADIFWKYGEERYSRKIAGEIIKQRKNKPVKTTFDLTEIVKKSVPGSYAMGRLNPATKVFQALRIYVNNELGNLENFLKNINKVIKPKGRTVIISFHSLEDRLVKNYFREMAKKEEAEILTKKPISPALDEIKNNPRSRSAKLRAIIYDNNPTQ